MKECEVFNVSLSICGFSELKLRIHASYSGYNSICTNDKEICMTAKDQEHRFRGSISLTINDCIIGTVFAYYSVLNNDDMIHGFL